MNKANKISKLAIWRQRTPGLAEIEVLLDLLPTAALLMDRGGERILLANAATTELTAYTRVELLDLHLDQLLTPNKETGLEPPADPTLREMELNLTTRGGRQIEVIVTRTNMHPDGQWFILTMQSLANRRQQQTETTRRTQRLDALLDLVTSTHQPDLESALSKALDAARNLAGGTALAFYQIFTPDPGLHLTVNSGDRQALPEYIPPGEINQFTGPYLWTRRKHASTSLEQAARAAHFNYMATVPLGQGQAMLGLFVIGGTEPDPPEKLISIARIVAASATTTLQAHIFQSNLAAQVDKQRSTLAIGETVQDAVHDGIIILTPDLNILEMNAFAELLLGYPATEVLGEPVQNIMIGTSSLTSALRMAQQGIPTHDLGNLHLHSRDGQAFLALVRTIPVVIDEITDKIIILIHDLSEHEQFRVRTQQLEHRALLGEVTAIFAHEVRNPINNISSGLQLMAHTLPEESPHRENINRLLHECVRLDHHMKAVLDFSRNTEYVMEPLDLPGMIQRLLDLWRPRLNRVNVTALPQFAPQTPRVWGDPRALEQVFTNLISNAVQAMTDQGGTLAVKIMPLDQPGERKKVEISISDTGPGIPEEHRERIFEPFFTTNPQGTGLGLAITKRIILAHRGNIKVTSVPGGTMFHMILPAFDGSPPEEDET